MYAPVSHESVWDCGKEISSRETEDLNSSPVFFLDKQGHLSKQK